MMRTKIITFLTIGASLVACGKKPQEGSSELIKSSIIVGSVDWKEITTLRRTHRVRKIANAVGDINLPMVGSRCTGFLISKDILMTNHHCIPSARHARGVTVKFNNIAGVKPAQHVKYDCSTFIGNNQPLDYALLKCKKSPGLKYGTVELSSDRARAGQKIYVIQQNCDYYTQRNCAWTKKYAVGKVKKLDKEIVHDADTLGGSSGSPVFDLRTHEVIGLHHAGYGNNGLGRGVENYAVPMEKIVQDIMTRFPAIDLGANEGSAAGSTSFEPNESRQKAISLTAKSQVIKGLAIDKSGDRDYFKFTIKRNSRIKASITFKNSQGNLSLYLIRTTGSTIRKSTSFTDNEAVSVALRPGTYVIKVIGSRGATNKYDLNLQVAKY